MKKIIKITENKLITLIKNIIVEESENDYFEITPEQYHKLLVSVNFNAKVISRLPMFKGKKIRVNGNLNLNGLRQITSLGDLTVSGQLDIPYTGIKNLDGVKFEKLGSYHMTPYADEIEKKRLKQEREDANERRINDEWNIKNTDEISEMANAVFDYMVQQNDIGYLDGREREELEDLEIQMVELEEKIDNEEDDEILDDLYTERDELEENIDALKEKDNDQYGLVPEDRHSHYKMTVFKSIHDDTNGNIYAVGTEGEVDDSIEEYYEDMVNDLNNFDKSTLSYHIDGEDVYDHFEDSIRDDIYENYEDYDISKETSKEQDQEIINLRNEKKSLEIENYLISNGARSPLIEEGIESMKYFKFKDYMNNLLVVEWSDDKWQIYQNNKKVESVTYEDEDEDGEHESDNESRIEEIENRAEEIDSEIEEIEENPDGDLSDDDIERVMEEKKDEIESDPISWLDDYGMNYGNFVNTRSLLRDLIDESDYSVISHYDGDYQEVNINSNTYIVFRTE
jgi:hypothetical protein